MNRANRLVAALAVTAGGWLLVAGGAGAHDGAEHATHSSGLLDTGTGLGLVVVALVAGVGYWLCNRTESQPRVPDSRDRTILLTRRTHFPSGRDTGGR